MTRKDYVLLARAIRDSLIQTTKWEWQDRYATQHAVTVERLADVLMQENPRFDRQRFVAACGVLVNTEAA